MPKTPLLQKAEKAIDATVKRLKKVPRDLGKLGEKKVATGSFVFALVVLALVFLGFVLFLVLGFLDLRGHSAEPGWWFGK